MEQNHRHVKNCCKNCCKNCFVAKIAPLLQKLLRCAFCFANTVSFKVRHQWCLCRCHASSPWCCCHPPLGRCPPLSPPTVEQWDHSSSKHTLTLAGLGARIERPELEQSSRFQPGFLNSPSQQKGGKVGRCRWSFSTPAVPDSTSAAQVAAMRTDAASEALLCVATHTSVRGGEDDAPSLSVCCFAQ